FLTASVPLLSAAPAARASAGEVQQQSPRSGAADAHTLAITITGMTPTTAGPHSTVTVRGTLANRTGAPVSGISVQASTSTFWFVFPAQMTEFTDGLSTGASVLPLQPAGQSYQVTSAVPNGATVQWAVSFQASIYGQFGVYPVQVQATAASTAQTAAARTF